MAAAAAAAAQAAARAAAGVGAGVESAQTGGAGEDEGVDDNGEDDEDGGGGWSDVRSAIRAPVLDDRWDENVLTNMLLTSHLERRTERNVEGGAMTLLERRNEGVQV